MKKLILGLLMFCGFAAAQCVPLTTSSMQCPVPSGSSTTVYYGVIWNTAKTGVTNGLTTSSAGQFVGIAGSTITGASGQTVVVYLPGNYCIGACGIAFDGTPVAGDGFRWSTSTAGQMNDIGSGNCNSQCIGFVSGTSATNSTGYLLGHLPDATAGVLGSGATATQQGSTLYIVNNAGSSTAFTYTLPAAIGAAANGGPIQQLCFVDGASSGRTNSTGTLTITAASGDYIRNVAGTFGSSAGNEASGGAAADFGCFISMQANQWQFIAVHGTWTP